MNCEMWDKPSVQRNVEQLRSDGVMLVEPEEGWLRCRQHGWVAWRRRKRSSPRLPSNWRRTATDAD